MNKNKITEFTIEGANKSVKKIFSSRQEAEAFIEEKNLYPANDFINIVETIVISHKVESKISNQLNLIYKQRLLEWALSSDWYYADTSIMQPVFYWYHHTKNKLDVGKGIDIALKIFQENGIQEEDFQEYMDVWLQFDKMKQTRLGKFLENHQDRLTKEWLSQIFSHENCQFDVIYVKTNYKLCNSICLRTKFDYSQMNFMIRLDDQLITPHNIYGKNVAVKNETLVNDDFLKKLIDSHWIHLESVIQP